MSGKNYIEYMLCSNAATGFCRQSGVDNVLPILITGSIRGFYRLIKRFSPALKLSAIPFQAAESERG